MPVSLYSINIKANVKKKVSQSCNGGQTSHLEGAALPSRPRWLCQKSRDAHCCHMGSQHMLATPGRCWGQHVLKTRGRWPWWLPAKLPHVGSGLSPAARAHVGPAKTRTGLLLSSVSKPTAKRKQSDMLLSLAFPTCPLIQVGTEEGNPRGGRGEDTKHRGAS